MKRTLYSLLLTLLVAISSLQTAKAGRMYDPEVSRFLSIDPALHEQMPQQLLANHPRLLSDSPYSYGYNNPLRFTDPDGKTPWDLLDIAFAVMSVKDAIQDPSASNIFWAGVDVLAAAAPILPSSRGVRMGLNALDAVDDVADATKVVDKAEDVASGAKNVKNPFGSKGKPDHQAKVGELKQKAIDENPGMDVVTEGKINLDGSNRRPDVQVIDPKTGKTTKIYEAERRPNSKRNKNREAEYDKLGIPHETHKVGGN
jgi:RHS repeat-associated protein